MKEAKKEKKHTCTHPLIYRSFFILLPSIHVCVFPWLYLKAVNFNAKTPFNFSRFSIKPQTERINLSRIMCSFEHLCYRCAEATIIGIMVIFTSGSSQRQESILSRWAWLTKEDKNLEGFNQKQYSLHFNLNCFQVYIKLLCFQQCSSLNTCFVLQSLGKQVLPLYLKLLYWSTSLTCSVILLFYSDQC